MRKINQATGIAPHSLCCVRDLGDTWISSPFHLESSLHEIEARFREVLAAGITPISVGGDHSITLPIMRAIGNGAIGMVHFDAHCDTGDDYLGSRFHHGAPFRRAVEEGLLDPERTVQIGIRGSLNDPEQWQFSHTSGMRVVYMEELHARGWQNVMDEARAIIGAGPAYLSFDVDGLDPAYAPGTGTPEIGGFSSFEAQQMIRALQGLDLIGGDVVEVAPAFDPSGNTALVAATLMFEMLCVIADSRVRRKGS